MKQKRWLYHLGGWSLVLLYDLIAAWRDGGGALLRVSFFLSLLAAFYYGFLLVYPRFRKRYFLLLFLPLVFSGVRYGLEQVLYPNFFGVSNYGAGVKLFFYLQDNLFYSVAIAVVSAAVWSTQHAFDQQQENEVLRKEKQAAELAFLRAQINPHFLYNSLNLLYSMAYPVSEELADAIVKLSELMRYLLKQSADGRVDLQQDITYLEHYIALYRLRFGEHFYVDVQTSGEVAGHRIAPLILIPFIENAFKHGVTDDPQRPVRIRLKLTGGQLQFSAANQIGHGQKDPAGGIGLANTRRRLQLLYPERHELLVSQNSLSYKITLNITL